MFCLLILLAVSCFLDPKQPQRIILSVRKREAIQEKWGNSRIRINSLLPISLLIYPPPWICPVGWTGERGAGAADLPGRNVPVLQPWRTHHRLPQAICPRVSNIFFISLSYSWLSSFSLFLINITVGSVTFLWLVCPSVGRSVYVIFPKRTESYTSMLLVIIIETPLSFNIFTFYHNNLWLFKTDSYITASQVPGPLQLPRAGHLRWPLQAIQPQQSKDQQATRPCGSRRLRL